VKLATGVVDTARGVADSRKTIAPRLTFTAVGETSFKPPKISDFENPRRERTTTNYDFLIIIITP
jgi:hypothetical protein